MDIPVTNYLEDNIDEVCENANCAEFQSHNIKYNYKALAVFGGNFCTASVFARSRLTFWTSILTVKIIIISVQVEKLSECVDVPVYKNTNPQIIFCIIWHHWCTVYKSWVRQKVYANCRPSVHLRAKPRTVVLRVLFLHRFFLIETQEVKPNLWQLIGA